MKTINNDYNAIARSWWEEEEGSCSTIRYFINPVRVAFFRNVMNGHYAEGPAGKKALDVGCGGGFLSEELSRSGLRVTGIDPSTESLAVAREHAAGNGLTIDYVPGDGEHLPFQDQTFDMVFCCDVLEHVKDMPRVISEISRVLRTGGMFFYDTINRTILSRIAVIYFLQECGLTAFCRSHMHVWKMFIKPVELDSVMKRHGMTAVQKRGISPKAGAPACLAGLYRAAHNTISYRDLAARMGFHESGDLSCSYMGYGIKDR